MSPQKRPKLDHGGQTHVGNNSSYLNDMQSQEVLAVLSNVPSVLARVSVGDKRENNTDTHAVYSGDSYKSSIFKLQTDEMLADVQKHSSDGLERVDRALRTLKATIESIEEIGALAVSDCLRYSTR